VREFEERLGVRLHSRTTRSVPPTEAGDRLVHTVGPRLEEIDAELSSLGDLRGKPAGTVRITAGEHAAQTVLWPKLSKLLPRYPDIKLELIVDYGLRDIVAERCDAGVRSGECCASRRRSTGPASRICRRTKCVETSVRDDSFACGPTGVRRMSDITCTIQADDICRLHSLLWSKHSAIGNDCHWIPICYWHYSDLPACPLSRRYRGYSGR
jgi:DNA-binding transcriptional LysR family regulator